MNTNTTIIMDSTAMRTYSKICTFAGTALFGWLGKKAAEKMGCKKNGQIAGAAVGIIGYSTLLSKGEKMWDERMSELDNRVWDEEDPMA